MSGETGSELSAMRVSDADRELVVTRLNEATAEGRLSLEEFGDRVSQALASRTRGELDVVVRDLPVAGGSPAPVVGSDRLVVSSTPVGAVKRSGRWRLHRDMKLGAVVGAVKLDLRHAQLPAAEVRLHVEAVIGSVKVWIPRGIEVEVSGSTVIGSRSVEEDVAPPHAPLLRLRVDTVVGSVKIYRV
jgi:hypothetical protein